MWTGQLVDLTARNNLLYYRDLKAGTLDLGPVPEDRLFDLLGGRSLPVSRLFLEEAARSDAVRRARTIRNRGQEHFEERGLETVYLACGMATWTRSDSSATPCAPVLLVPARISARGAAQEDLDLAVTGELEVNPTLLQMLASEFDVKCEPEELMKASGMDGAIDTPGELDLAFLWLARKAASVPGFLVSRRFVVGTFSYAKLPMVKDLESAFDVMEKHDLVAAIAGDEEARQAVGRRCATELTERQPDFEPPADEFLVLDADASQNYAINAVLRGQDLIIKGPPGTGKSQTIANLISTLVARGRRVLFVAEKRAAIDAVLSRLEGVGLADLVLDMHGGGGSRRQVAQELASALAGLGRVPQGNYTKAHEHLVARRDELNAREEALHAPRPPWGVSLFEVQNGILALDPSAQTQVRFRRRVLKGLAGPAREAARENLRTYVSLGGPELTESGSPWARSSITSSEGCEAAQALAERIRHHSLPNTRAALESAATETGLRLPQELDGWPERFAAWDQASQTLEVFEASLFDEPLAEHEAALAPLGEGAAKRAAAALTSGEFRAARAAVKGHVRPGVSAKGPALLAKLTAARTQADSWRSLSDRDSAPAVPPQLEQLRASFGQLQAELDVLREVSGAPLDGTADDIEDTLDALLDDAVTLGRLPELFRLRTALEGAGLAELLEDCANRNLTPESAQLAFDHAWHCSLLDHIRFSDSRVGAFDGDQHSRVVTEFQAADRQHIETTAQRVRRISAEAAVRAQDSYDQQAALLVSQAARKRGHLSMRQLFSGAPDVLLALKPCWAMSPLVVSQLLPNDQQYFDVVVFDEASQVRPADAVPAILRGKRVVVAGDERQLPPTSFFTGAVPDGDGGATPDGALAVDAGYESILEALLPFLDCRMLGWHYRSQDERLIAFSNVYLYDRGMTTFPGVSGPDCIQHLHVPHVAGEPGSERSAAAEVNAVVDLVLEHAEQRPNETLGVIAMGITHADRIDEALRQRLRERSDLDAFFDDRNAERFFIKNLERVQGDERDAIILSIGYGKNAEGRLLYRFGPLNQEGGERRLNVAVTRAKRRMTLVSSFAFADMDPDRSSARGVELLRLYLQYAESQGRNLGSAAEAIPELNPFEVDVRDRLNAAGVPLTAQYGVSGFRIDFAAKHPTEPGRMVLAIECDGASYHSSATARDRDRLRQQHLERLGWTFHRIWSQDWFENKERETEKAVAAYQRAVERAQNGGEDEPPAPGQAPVVPIEMPERGSRPGIPRGRKIDEYSHKQLRALVRWLQSDTHLRTEDQMVAEVMADLGFARRGKRIVEAITAAIRAEDARLTRTNSTGTKRRTGSPAASSGKTR